MRASHTIVIERNTVWQDEFVTEPCEVAWASEAIFFIRALEVHGVRSGNSARIQLSPDGINWCDESDGIRLPIEPEISYHRLTHFGGWLRLAGQLQPGVSMKVIVYLALKE